MLKINFEFDGVAYDEQPMHLVDLSDKDLSDVDREMINKELDQIAEFLCENDEYQTNYGME